MSTVAIEVNHVWKRFHRGEIHDSLRDFIPALARRMFGRGPKREELGEGDFWALRDVSFQVKQGEVLGIIGPNGAGKSTLLKVLARIIRPNRGNMRVNGRLRALIEIAAGFHPDLTGRENVYLNGTILGMKKREIDAKFDEIVEFSGIEEFLDMPVKRYSSGMYARLGFAVAAHLEPEVLIVDEVLAVGDAEFQKRCFGKMGDVSREGRTVLLVSHNMSAIKGLCGQCLWLDQGKLREAGSTHEVVTRYLDEYGLQLHASSRPEVCAERGEERLTNPPPTHGVYEIRCGDKVTLDFSVELAHSVDQIGVGVVLLDDNGNTVMGMNSVVQRVTSEPGPAHCWRVCCDMGSIPLNASTYSTRVHVMDGHRELARFPNAQFIVVHEHDVFGWGNSLPPVKSWGHLYWAPRWEITPSVRGPLPPNAEIDYSRKTKGL